MELHHLNLSKRMIEKCQRAGINRVEDILYHVPFRYDHIEQIPYQEWLIGDKVWLEGEIVEPYRMQYLPQKRSLTRFHLASEIGLFSVSIFNRPWLKVGMKITLQARFEGKHQLTGLNYNLLALSEQLGWIPVYHSSKDLTQKDWVKLVEKSLHSLASLNLVDVPQALRQKYRLMSLKQALSSIHTAPDEATIHQATRTLKYEEFLRFQTKLRLNRLTDQHTAFGVHKLFDRRVILKHLDKLPFVLSDDQRKVLDEILDDLQTKQRMNRLLQGDVGSGKTVIAALAMYATVLAHYQAAMMVPTEILARQHVATLRAYLPANVSIELLVSAMSVAQRASVLKRLSQGEIDIVVGTQALIQDDVVFKNCGLVVADEQHRFGVQQRRSLSQKGEKVDFLLMSATPIPRTLAAVLYNDMAVSSIFQYHAGKAKTHTHLILENSLRSIYPELLKRIEDHDQVYVVCPSIEDQEDSELRNVEAITKAFLKVMPKHIRISSLHGKLSPQQKDQVLNAFYQHNLDILVTTTVIEVGVHVEQANTMVVYDSDRFGLSQLHQLRGRIGRGQRKGLCYLLTDTKEPSTLQRLRVLVESNDGFEIANKDLQLRGPGELFGLKQSGLPSFRIANVILDQVILKTAQQDANDLFSQTSSDAHEWIERCREELLSQSLD